MQMMIFKGCWNSLTLRWYEWRGAGHCFVIWVLKISCSHVFCTLYANGREEMRVHIGLYSIELSDHSLSEQISTIKIQMTIITVEICCPLYKTASLRITKCRYRI